MLLPEAVELLVAVEAWLVEVVVEVCVLDAYVLVAAVVDCSVARTLEAEFLAEFVDEDKPVFDVVSVVKLEV